MIVSSLKFDSIIVRILKPTPLLSYNQYKNGSLCLDTLYKTKVQRRSSSVLESFLSRNLYYATHLYDSLKDCWHQLVESSLLTMSSENDVRKGTYSKLV